MKNPFAGLCAVLFLLGLAGCRVSATHYPEATARTTGPAARDLLRAGPATAPGYVSSGALLAEPGYVSSGTLRWPAKGNNRFGGRISYVGQLRPREVGSPAGVLVEVNYVADLDRQFAVEVSTGFFFGDAPQVPPYSEIVMIPVTVTGQLYFYQHWYLGLGGGVFFTDHRESVGWLVAMGARIFDPGRSRFNLILDARYINTENMGIEIYTLGANLQWRF